MKLFTGSGVAMITPFDDKGINYKATEELIEHLISNGTGAIFVCGTTGEPCTMTDKECRELVSFTLDKVKSRVPVYVGTGSNNTMHAIEKSKEAENLGADGLLVVTPYYNKCTQKGIVEHYGAIAKNVGIPIIAYNVPTRTNVNIAPTTILRLAEIKNIAALKEASGDIDQILEVARVLSTTDMVWYSGDDSLTVVAMLLGAKGVISVAANVIPKEMAAMTKFAACGKWNEAREIQFKYAPLMKQLFCEVNPIPVKKAVNYLGIDAGIPRLPLTEMESDHAENLKEVMIKLNIIK